jgi:hypothetical protein
MPITETPSPSNPDSGRSLGHTWNKQTYSDVGGPYNQPRVRAGYDLIRAQDINEIRQELELLLEHTHEYTDAASSGSSSGGTTTTCG